MKEKTRIQKFLLREDILSPTAGVLTWGEGKVIINLILYREAKFLWPKGRSFYLHKGNARHESSNLIAFQKQCRHYKFKRPDSKGCLQQSQKQASTERTKIISRCLEDKRSDEVAAELTFKDGTKEYREFYYGTGYLSQSSRVCPVPPGVVSVTFKTYKGGTRQIVTKAN